MEVRYILTDRNGTTYQVEDFEGWDKEKEELTRDKNWHGVTSSVGGQNLKFDGLAAVLLRKEWEQYRSEGILFITRQIECDGEWIDTFNGKFVFASYRYVCSDRECYVTGLIDELGDMETIQNLINQKVDLDSLKSFDETTDLPAYNFLGKEYLLPSKGILLQNDGENDAIQETEVMGAPVNNGDGSSDNGNSEIGIIEFGLNKTVSSEIGSFVIREKPFYNCLSTYSAHFFGNGCNDAPLFDLYPDHSTLPGTDIKILGLSPIVNYGEGTSNYGAVSDVIDFNVNLSVNLTPLQVTTMLPKSYLVRLPYGASGEHAYDYEWLFEAEGSTSIIYHNPNFIIQPGDRIYAFIWLYHYKTQEQTLTGTPGFKLSNSIGDFFRMKTLTHAPATKSKLYLVNEVLSRIVESYTDGRVRAYSEYFGRIDSQPYAISQDGCGSLEAITDGIRIRKAENHIPDQPSKFTQSLQDMLLGLNPIHAIGFGLEDDTNRPGYKVIRVEPWQYFYKSDIILHCTGIQKIERKANDKEIFSTVRIGYSKYEAEQYNGLDEFLTERFFRSLGISAVKNDFQQLSTFISSGYAWEITRRLGSLTSQDWRFDKDTFIACLRRGIFTIYIPDGGLGGFAEIFPAIPGLAPGDEITITETGDNGIDGTYTVSFPISAGGSTTASLSPYALNTGTFYGLIELNGTPIVSSELGIELGNVDNDSNIIDPDTLYNWRIRPHYNAIRWFSYLAMTWGVYDNAAALVFMDGKGNYHERGEMHSTDCKLENGPINGDDKINKQIFADPDAQRPIRKPERIEFDYPITAKDYLALKANPLGLIYYQGGSDCEEGEGWIDKVTFDRWAGTAKFSLIPKIDY